jgi:uncharacterized protein
MSINETKDGLIITICVKPNSPKFQVIHNNDEIIVNSTHKPVNGKVNREIIKELSKRWHTNVELVSGFTSRRKKFLIRGVKKSEIDLS